MHYITNKTNTNFWSEFLLKHPMPEYEYHNIKRFIEDMKTNKEDFSYLMQLPSWQLYNWMPIYAGNSFKVSKDSFDKNELEEYNKILTFLGATPFDEKFVFNPNIHKRDYLTESVFTEQDKKLLYEFYSPYNERLYTFLGRRIPSWDEFYVKNDLQQ